MIPFSRRIRSGQVAALLSVPVLALVVAACGGGGGGGGGGGNGGFSDSGGEGTNTLKIVASVAVEDGSVDSVNVAVTEAGSAAVSGAMVVLTTPDEEITLIEETPGLGFYSLPGGSIEYAGGYRLAVERNEDSATDITIRSPGLTEVTNPPSQSAISRNEPLDVTWAGTGATEHRVELLINDFDSGWTDGDPGSYVIEALSINTAGTETLTVRRRKELPITSGLPGSVLRIDLKDEVVPLAVE